MVKEALLHSGANQLAVTAHKVDLLPKSYAGDLPMPIHLGYRLGRNHLISHLDALQALGVNHVTFALRFSTRPIDEIVDELCEYVVPHFPALAV